MTGASGTLWKIGWRYLLRHAWQSVLMGLGIALGVAVVVAIDLANASAERAFELSTEAVTGRATHQIVGGPGGIEEGIYAEIRKDAALVPAAPVLSEYVTSAQLGERPLQLLGIDPFSEAPFRSYLGDNTAVSIEQLTAFLTQPGAVLISIENAERYGLEIGSEIVLDVGGRQQSAVIVGLLQPIDSLSRRTLSGLILADISTVQELTGRFGKLDRIDLILPEANPGLVERLNDILPTGIQVTPVDARTGTIQQMTSAFRVNLTALSLLALLVGLFLIYNTMTFSVVQRRHLFGVLRCLGVTRSEIFRLVVSEAFIIGLVGAIVGILLGMLWGQSTIRMVLQTINDLYFTTTIQEVGLPVFSLVKGILLGVLASMLTAIPPAWEAASVPPQAALSRSGLEVKARRSTMWTAAIGLVLISLSLGLFYYPTDSLFTGFLGTFTVVVGFSMLAAFTLTVLMRLAAPLTGKVFGLLGRMAPRNLVNTLSRTSVAVAALMIAVGVTVAVSLMIRSFRSTVTTWLEQSLQGDVYISAPFFVSTQVSTLIDPSLITLVESRDEVQRVDLLRSTQVESPSGSIQVAATSNPNTGTERYYKIRKGSPEEIWPAMQAGGVIVSEPLANRLNLTTTESSLVLNTPTGQRTFPVVGIYYDYSSSLGTVVMDLDIYQQLWDDTGITALGLHIMPGVDPDAMARSLEDELQGRQKLVIRPNRALRDDVLEIFDRTFAITGALQILATTVAFIGVLNALLLLQLEKQREAGILRAIGLTARQLWGLVMLETGLMGLVAGLLAMPTGYALTLILIYVINQRSFGWTLQIDLVPGPFVQALLLALAAALLAGIYPARKLGKMVAAEAMRYE